MIRKLAILGLMLLSIPAALSLTGCQNTGQQPFGVTGTSGQIPVTNDKGRVVGYRDAGMNMNMR
jgi:hypothetical protein